MTYDLVVNLISLSVYFNYSSLFKAFARFLRYGFMKFGVKLFFTRYFFQSDLVQFVQKSFIDERYAVEKSLFDPIAAAKRPFKSSSTGSMHFITLALPSSMLSATAAAFRLL